VADIRRGGSNIYNRTLQSVKTSVKNGLITGVAISVCKTNFEMALSDSFIRMLHDNGVLYFGITSIGLRVKFPTTNWP